jgi:hypothetical protein
LDCWDADLFCHFKTFGGDMNRLDTIIDALELARNEIHDPTLWTDKVDKALAAARELKALKPVAWVTQRTGDGGRVLDGFETCDFDDYGAIPVYALDEVTK